MRAEAARVRRLQRLEKVRAHAKQAAALEAARAEVTLAQLEALAARTEAMAADYRGRTGLRDGLELRQLGQFVAGLTGINNTTRGDALQAQQLADAKQQELALAERRRVAVEDRARLGERALAQRLQTPVLGSRRAVGTGLE
ncbi:MULTISPECIES: hypothetical protein [unclassified Novosphingobium]|uniref:hypothetical protein n=1 Tax=unclassified Novosphingobium TaxID=2644732 RepID=UPI000EE446D2|nr:MULTISPECIES: hypothetical protein [unclassified Novosphingobium]HCF24401.1 hypothetical protein [Novosphingobium sp.]HQV03782.1 hypothetical protein [Novosphingobium sp.]